MEAIIVYNPSSGKGKFGRKIESVKKRLFERNIYVINVFLSKGPNTIPQFIKEYCTKRPVEVIIVAGGDGTLNEALQGIMELPYKPKVGYIPSGTANDVGSILGIKKKIHQALDLIAYPNLTQMDIGCINGRYFIYVAGCGKFTDISYEPLYPKMKKRFGRFYYFIEAFLALPKGSTMRVKITTADMSIDETYYVILCLNAQRVGGFKYYLRKPSKLNDGLMELILFRKKRILSFYNFTRFFLFGGLIRGGTKIIKSDHFTIESETDLAYNTDGEKAFVGKRAEVTICNKALNIFVAKKKRKKLF